MRWTIERDILTMQHPSGVEVGHLPKGVGLERLRWTGTELVDLAELAEMWVDPADLSLHAIDVGGCALVAMTYADRGRLEKTSMGGVRLGALQETVDKWRFELYERLDQVTKRTIMLWPAGVVRYDEAKQSTLLASAMKLDQALANPALDDPATRDILQAKRGRIDEVWAWIESVITYRNQQQAALDAALTVEELETVAGGWDFAQFSATDPDVSIKEVML